MEVSYDVIMNVALDAAGYMAAGGLGVLIYAMFKGRRPRSKLATPVLQSAAATGQTIQDGLVETTRPLQFLDLSNVPRSQYRAPASTARPLLDVAREDSGDQTKTARPARTQSLAPQSGRMRGDLTNDNS